MSGGQAGERDGIWTEELEIHSYDVDIARKATMEGLLKYFQEAAWNHAEHLGLGYSHLRCRGQVWMLSRMMVVVDTYPEWGQSVVARTWPRKVTVRSWQSSASISWLRTANPAGPGTAAAKIARPSSAVQE